MDLQHPGSPTPVLMLFKWCVMLNQYRKSLAVEGTVGRQEQHDDIWEMRLISVRTSDQATLESNLDVTGALW